MNALIQCSLTTILFLNYVQVLNEALLGREEINVGWVFARNADFENITECVKGLVNAKLC
jgi:hypothetical protein